MTKFGSIAKRKTADRDSIYDVSEPKVKMLKLNNDSNALGFAVFLNKDILGMDLSSQQKSDVFQNTFIV